MRSRDRALAIAAAEGTCPRCGAPRDSGQRYCLECGLALPVVVGRLPALRRRWIQRFGWYPGDWVWISLLTLAVAVAGAAAAIALTETRTELRGPVFVATPGVSVTEPTPVVTATSPGTTTLPSPPEATTTAPTKPPAPPNGRLPWPAAENGWTIVLVSYPKTNGRPSALQTASKAASAGLRKVGILDSGLYSSLQPGYYVVFTGIYPSKSDADASVPTARNAGFAGAYSRQIAR